MLKTHDPALRLLANLEASIRTEKARLTKMQTEGVDHFKAGPMAKLHEHLDDSTLDGYAREADALKNSHTRA